VERGGIEMLSKDYQEWLNNFEKKLKMLKKETDVPKHVKNYRKHNITYKSTGESKARAWF
jgi:hypothetical protein